MQIFFSIFCFFFQAEDGIRDYKVTGVQTCALPICEREHGVRAGLDLAVHGPRQMDAEERKFGIGDRIDEPADDVLALRPRSEERRVGKECRSRWSPYH